IGECRARLEYVGGLGRVDDVDGVERLRELEQLTVQATLLVEVERLLDLGGTELADHLQIEADLLLVVRVVHGNRRVRGGTLRKRRQDALERLLIFVERATIEGGGVGRARRELEPRDDDRAAGARDRNRHAVALLEAGALTERARIRSPASQPQ